MISTYTIWWGQHKQTPCLSSTASFDSSLHLAYLQMPSDSGGNSAAVLTASHLEAFLYLRKSEVFKPVRVQSELTCCPFHRQLMGDNDLTYGVWVWIPLWHHRFVVIGWFSSVKKKKKKICYTSTRQTSGSARVCLSTHLSISLSMLSSPSPFSASSFCLLVRSLAIASAPPFRNLTKFSPTSGPMAYMPGPFAAITLFVNGSTSIGFLRHEMGSSGFTPSERPLLSRKERLGWAPIRTRALETWTTVRSPASDSRTHFRSGLNSTTLWRGKLR